MFRWQKVFLLLLVLSSSPLFAASWGEKNAFNAAVKAFDARDWFNAETNFAAFVQKFPESENIPEAIVRQAQARFEMQQYTGVVTLLSNSLYRAGMNADEFVFWIAHAQLAAGNYSAAADTFAQLTEKFPGSLKRLDACIGEAEARGKLEQWPRVVLLLQKSDGVFQQQLKAGAASPLIADGYLLLGEAQLAREDFAAVNETISRLGTRALSANQSWRREFLECRAQLAAGHADEAVQTTTNLIAAAETAKSSDFRAASYTLQGKILERLGQTANAIAAYTNNLSTSAPAAQQRTAMLKIAELSLAQNRIADAVQTFENFLRDYTNSAATDVAVATLGELRLRQYLADTNATDLLNRAGQEFDSLFQKFPDSPTLGKAWLNKGWCFWLQTNYPGSIEAFQNAALRLQSPEDQAVARFKWADAQFMTGDFSGAITNYNFIADHLRSSAEVRDHFAEAALYQTVHAALELRNLTLATNALDKILAWYPQSFTGGRSLLLAGQGFVQTGNPAQARDLFARFEQMFPTNSLAAEARLAIARSYEQEGKWDAAITNYESWITSYPDDSKRATAEFYRALANYKAGQETNALVLFTNFVARFTNDPLVLQAQWWIGDYCFQSGDLVGAEKNFRLISLDTNWPSAELKHPAQMMAGRAALARQNYPVATNYFIKLASDTNCPLEFRLEATFACGDALISQPEPDWNEAISWFSSITTAYPTNEVAPLAWGLIGNCNLQLGKLEKYAVAAKAYQQVLDMPQSSVTARSQARVGLGIVAEKFAKQADGEQRTTLLRQALGHYESVIFGKDLREGERPDLAWVKEAGVNAMRVASEQLNDWELATNIGEQIADSFPELRPVFQNRLARMREHLASAQK